MTIECVEYLIRNRELLMGLFHGPSLVGLRAASQMCYILSEFPLQATQVEARPRKERHELGILHDFSEDAFNKDVDSVVPS